MNAGDNPQHKLVADGKLCEALRYSPCCICGHADGGDGDAIIISAAMTVCRRCWQYAKNFIPQNN
jgi:ribosome-binding protein aMBF1 (putative translation factor)